MTNLDINVKLKPNLKIRAFYLFFIIYGIQIGVGVMGIPRYIFEKAHQDSWISILMMLLFMIIVAYVMIRILKQYENADIFGIQVDIFGKWIGKVLGSIYILYFAASFISIILTYIEVVQVFLYPTMPSFIIGLLLLCLVVYSVLGGIKTIVGVVFLFFFLTQWLLFLLYDPITRLDWDHFLPMFQASFPELLEGAKATTYTVSGFEILFVIYPFIDNKEKAKLPVFLGLCYTTFIVLISTIVAIGYFSTEDLGDVEWSVLTLFKSAAFTFIERLDYIVIVEWMLVIIPNLVLLMWAMTYGMKRLYKVRQKITLYTVAIIVLIIVSIVRQDVHINKLTDLLSRFGFWLVFIYPLILFPIVLLKKRWRKMRGSAK